MEKAPYRLDDLPYTKEGSGQALPVFGQYADGSSRVLSQQGELLAKVTGEALKDCTLDERKHYVECQQNIISFELKVVRAALSQTHHGILEKYKANIDSFVVHTVWDRPQLDILHKDDLRAMEAQLLAKLKWIDTLDWYLNISAVDKQSTQGAQAALLPAMQLPVPPQIIQALEHSESIQYERTLVQSPFMDSAMGINITPTLEIASIDRSEFATINALSLKKDEGISGAHNDLPSSQGPRNDTKEASAHSDNIYLHSALHDSLKSARPCLSMRAKKYLTPDRPSLPCFPAECGDYVSSAIG
ncbi:hypothetical protein TruAng_010288 [Truncatella angustata]|nr:hypothetical protein TruAng_010288 [Truncatella angustata]